MARRLATIKISVEISDLTELRRAAEVRAGEEGLSMEEWYDLRTGTEDDLRMLFDPGISPPGTQIEYSEVTLERFAL